MKKEFSPKHKAESMLDVLREDESLIEISRRLGAYLNMLGNWKN